jgi:hypothetical protein
LDGLNSYFIYEVVLLEQPYFYETNKKEALLSKSKRCGLGSWHSSTLTQYMIMTFG